MASFLQHQAPIKQAVATYFKHTGFTLQLDMSNARKFTLAELQAFVGGYIEVIKLPDGRELVLNEEGKIKGLPVNLEATAIWKKAFPIARYPENNVSDVRGHALLLENYLWPQE